MNVLALACLQISEDKPLALFIFVSPTRSLTQSKCSVMFLEEPSHKGIEFSIMTDTKEQHIRDPTGIVLFLPACLVEQADVAL